MNTGSGDPVTSCPQMEVLRGRDGVPGTPGRDGSQGRDGRDGGKGEKGDVGTVGATGPPGEKEGQGTKEPSGLPGPQGPSGISGPRGPVGERGDRGSPGLPGPQGVQGAQGPPTGGAVYTRWGRTSYPSNQGTELVYLGRAGGSHFHKHGGAANLLCLLNNPEYSTYGSGVNNYAPLRGAEYRGSGQPVCSVNSRNIPCAVRVLRLHQRHSADDSVSPRINERGGGGGFSGCAEYEIVSGGLVHVHTPFIV